MYMRMTIKAIRCDHAEVGERPPKNAEVGRRPPNNMDAGRRPAKRLLEAKSRSRIACWNVRTLLQVGAAKLLVEEMERYQIEIAVLSEIRWKAEKENSRFVDGKHQRFQIIYSGADRGLNGVGLVLSPLASNALVSYEGVSDRLLLATFRGRFGLLTVVAAYAPTEAAEESVKDDFYEMLQRTVARIPRKHYLVVAGDFNAQTGTDRRGWEKVLGLYGAGSLNDNGHRLLEFANWSRMVITNTVFPHKDIHRYTWKHPNGVDRAMIDYILVRQRWRSSVADTRVFRGAEFDTDHLLVVSELQLRLKVRKVGDKIPARLDIPKLASEEVRLRYSVAVSNRFETLMNSDDVEELWGDLKDGLQEVAEQSLGRRKFKKDEWISDRTLRLVEQKREIKHQDRHRYNLLNREVKRSCANDRELWWQSQAEKIEASSNKHDLKHVFGVLRFLSGRYTRLSDIILDKDGKPLRDKRICLERWAEYFHDLLNHDDPADLDDELDQLADVALPSDAVSAQAPDLEEVKSAIGKLKSGKAAGADNIAPELLKHGGDRLAQVVWHLVTKVWQCEKAPRDWKDAVIVPLFKKKDPKDCANYRGISLLSVTGKVYSRILFERIREHRDARTREQQAGFRPGRGCIDQIFTLRQVFEKREAFRKPFVVLFIDFKAAFDSVHRESIWKLLKVDGVPEKLIRLLRDLYDGGQSRVRAYGGYSKSFEVKTGVKQGCILSPSLFGLLIDRPLHKVFVGNSGLRISPELQIEDLDFADDVAVLAENAEEAQKVLDSLCKQCAKVGLSINALKTKVLFVGCTGDLALNGTPIEKVSQFMYLGSCFSDDGSIASEVQHRIGLASSAFSLLKRSLWLRQEVSVATKVRIYNAAILPCLLYGSETWTLLSDHLQKLEVFHMRCLRKITGVSLRQHLRNEEVRRMAGGSVTVEQMIRKRRLQWFGHVQRMDHTRLPLQVYKADPKGLGWKRPRAGPRKKWVDIIQKDVEPHLPRRRAKCDAVKWAAESAQDRDEWRSFCHQLMHMAPIAKLTASRRR